MVSKYGIFCKVLETKSFTKAAEILGYSQSAVSQTIKSLEQEMGVTLIERKKDGIRLTPDGEQYFPYLQSIYFAENALEQKHRDMQGLEKSIIRIGTFTSVSRNILPPLMKAFKEKYPAVTFVLRQGEYTSIGKWISEGSVDFGFVNKDAVFDIETCVLYEDEMMAVLPSSHVLSLNKRISLADIVDEPFILLDEGDYSVSLNAFRKVNLEPKVAYEVYDDYTILSMVRQGLGVSLMYSRVLTGFEQDLEIRPVTETPKRVVALAWKKWNTMPYASRRFIEFIMGNEV